MDDHVATLVENHLEVIPATPRVLDHLPAKVTAVRAHGRLSAAAGGNADRNFYQAATAIVRNLKNHLLRVTRVPLAAEKAVALVGDAAGGLADFRRHAATAG
jgi:hypothetical protein